MYRGLPCIYSSAILVCLSLLTGGNMAVLRLTALAMILFMVSQTLYPHDRVLESQAWKKVVYAGGTNAQEILFSPFFLISFNFKLHSYMRRDLISFAKIC